MKLHKIYKQTLLYVALLYSTFINSQSYCETCSSGASEALQAAEQYAKDNNITYSVNGVNFYSNPNVPTYDSSVTNISYHNGQYGQYSYVEGSASFCFLCENEKFKFNDERGRYAGQVVDGDRTIFLAIRLPEYKFRAFGNQNEVANALKRQARDNANVQTLKAYNAELNRLAGVSRLLFAQATQEQLNSNLNRLSNCSGCNNKIDVLDNKDEKVMELSLRFKVPLKEKDNSVRWLWSGISDGAMDGVAAAKILAGKAPTPPRTHALGRARKPIEDFNTNKFVADLKKGINDKEAKLKRENLSKTRTKLNSLIANIPSIVATTPTHKDYMKESAAALAQFNTGVKAHAIVVGAIDKATDYGKFIGPELLAMSTETNKILKNGKSADYKIDKLSVLKEKEVAKSATFLQTFKDIKQTLEQYLPRTEQERLAIAAILAPLLLEVGLAAIPGSELIDVFRGIQEEDYLKVGFAFAGLGATLFGGKIVKVVATFGRQLYKTFKILRVVGKHLQTIHGLITKGYKIAYNTVSNSVEVLKKNSRGVFEKLTNTNVTLQRTLDKAGRSSADEAVEVFEALNSATLKAQKKNFHLNLNKTGLLTKHQRGQFGEMATDIDLIDKGFIPLHKNIVKSVDDTCCIPGIDHVFKKDGKFYIVESKYNTSKLSKLSDGTIQMSDDWITKGDRLQKAVGTSLSREIQSKGYTRLLSNIKPDGTIFYTTLDSNAKPLIRGASL